jgi:hypothetical protein
MIAPVDVFDMSHSDSQGTGPLTVHPIDLHNPISKFCFLIRRNFSWRPYFSRRSYTIRWITTCHAYPISLDARPIYERKPTMFDNESESAATTPESVPSTEPEPTPQVAQQSAPEPEQPEQPVEATEEKGQGQAA